MELDELIQVALPALQAEKEKAHFTYEAVRLYANGQRDLRRNAAASYWHARRAVAACRRHIIDGVWHTDPADLPDSCSLVLAYVEIIDNPYELLFHDGNGWFTSPDFEEVEQSRVLAWTYLPAEPTTKTTQS